MPNPQQPNQNPKSENYSNTSDPRKNEQQKRGGMQNEPNDRNRSAQDEEAEESQK